MLVELDARKPCSYSEEGIDPLHVEVVQSGRRYNLSAKVLKPKATDEEQAIGKILEAGQNHKMK